MAFLLQWAQGTCTTVPTWLCSAACNVSCHYRKAPSIPDSKSTGVTAASLSLPLTALCFQHRAGAWINCWQRENCSLSAIRKACDHSLYITDTRPRQNRVSKLDACVTVLILPVCLWFNAYAVNLRAINSFLRKLICTQLQLIRVQRRVHQSWTPCWNRWLCCRHTLLHSCEG